MSVMRLPFLTWSTRRSISSGGSILPAITPLAAVIPPPLWPRSRSRRLIRPAVSLRGVFLAMKYEIPALLEVGGGAIVNTSSTAGLQAVGGLAAYVAAKHGIEGLTKVAALDYAARGVRVNAVAPGPILTENLIRAGESAQRAAAAAMPMQRVGQPAEAAAAIVWLCSDEASYITGATLVIDGGKLAGTPPFQVQLSPNI